MRVVWTIPALRNIEQIQDFIAQDSPATSYKLASDIILRTERLLSENLLIGRVGRVSDTRELVVSGTRYIVAYKLGDCVEILAVLHGSRKWPDRF